MNKDNYFLIVPASGVGTRMGSSTPKQYLRLENGLTIIDQCLKTLLEIKLISGFVVALSSTDSFFQSSHFYNHSKILAIAEGGKERFNSVLSALNSLNKTAQPNDWVLVHDSVRPCIKKSDIEKLIREVSNDSIGGILATSAIDTVKEKNASGSIKTIDRKKLYMAQTPQMFRFGILKEAIESAIKMGGKITDESEAIEKLGHSVKIIGGSSSNIKITAKDDIDLANYFLKKL
jgi:2-C-methyl-D-erythritol 4-phosphate cytidylyltransferase